MSDIREIERMTLYEYELRMTAWQLKTIDEDYNVHKQAWINRQVQATKTRGKKEVPYFKNFKEFFDYESQLQEILGTDSVSLPDKDRKILKMLKKANS